MSTKRKQEWFDNDEFWQDLYPFMFPEKRFETTPAELEKALALAQPAGMAALDHCCGPGRWSLALAEAGFAVTGVDPDSRWAGQALPFSPHGLFGPGITRAHGARRLRPGAALRQSGRCSL